MHEWKGFRELEENLNLLSEEMRERGVKRMLARGAVPMRDDARRRAPILKRADPRRLAGTVRDRIRIWLKKGTVYAVTFYVGVRGLSRGAISKFKAANRGQSAADNPNDPFYWRWQELGRAGQAPQPFLRPAFESMKFESVKMALEAGRDFVRATAARFKRVRP